MNRITFLSQMHKRSLAILEMIEKSDKRAQWEARFIIDAKTNPCEWHLYTLPIAEKNLEKYLQISYRLMKWYADVQVRVNKPIIEGRGNVKPIMSFKITEDHAVQLTGLS